MPKITVDKHGNPSAREGDIGTTRQATNMFAESKAVAMQSGSHHLFQ